MRRDLLSELPWLKAAIKSRLWQPIGMLVTLLCFVLAILAGAVGTPAGARNFAIVFVWIVWWGLLIVGLIPLLGRLWCAICPIPAPGEWLQRRGITGRVPGRLLSLHRKWPRQLRNIWLQNAGFLLVALFSALILTTPNLTAWMLLGFLLLGVLLSTVFDGRVFCRYVCPVGGFIGLYSLMSPLELRVKDVRVCQQHANKECLVGTVCSYGCPWLVYPGTLRRNAYCGLCGECLRGCSKDNIALNVRPFGSDLLVAGERRLDEAYKALIMLSCALLYSVVLLGPWGWLKNMANMRSITEWGLYALGFLAVTLLLIPGCFMAITTLSRRLGGLRTPLARLFADYAYGLVPLGLAGWVAFTLSFVLVNGSYAVPVLSDPFGWGWNLLGTTDFPWQPFLMLALPALQVATLLAGLAFSILIAYRIALQNSVGSYATQRAWWATLPVALFMAAVTFAFFRLYLG